MTLEDNFMINRFLEAIGTERYKTYRIYSKSITEADADVSGLLSARTN
jgi:hypothetical protein